ncbi:MAG: hypothetical protein QOF51_90 [Chloroflexota bacterium]|nr:hypothetical protein [Chloroflexota bacterium]
MAGSESANERSDHDPLIYTDLASWWPLFSAPAEYVDEAADAWQLLSGACDGALRTMLELGSGGGNNAFHLKAHAELTLVELAPQMLEVSRALNPECEHLQGDMRTVRLDRQFDAVFVHDAVMYMRTEADLRQAMETASIHCRPGGAALFEPDCVRETFEPSTDHGGEDGDERSIRWVEWTWDPDPNDTEVTVDYGYLLREADGSVRAVHDRHVDGLFPRDTWLRLLREVGFVAESVPDRFRQDVFICRKPPAAS